MMKYDNYLEIGLTAARVSGDLIKKSFSTQGYTFESKADRTPVTVIDKQCEELIKDIILGAFPTHAFLGEESGKTNDSEFIWIIDPIDGTKYFTHGIPLFATLIALMHENQLVVGISNAVAMNELVYAAKGQGAFKNGQPIHVSQTQELSQAFIGHGGIKYFQKNNTFSGLNTVINSAWGTKSIGDAWTYHLVASGQLDANVEAKVKIWDIAAPAIIIQEAGGMATDMFGDPIGLNTTTMLASNGQLHQQLVSLFRS